LLKNLFACLDDKGIGIINFEKLLILFFAIYMSTSNTNKIDLNIIQNQFLVFLGEISMNENKVGKKKQNNNLIKEFIFICKIG
jgi:hypothetical protein